MQLLIEDGLGARTMSSRNRKAAVGVLVVAFLSLPILLGPGIPAGIASGLIAGAFLVVVMQRPGGSTGERSDDGRFTASRGWKCPKSLDLDRLVASVGDQARLRSQSDGHRDGTHVVTLKGGSQLRTRLLGGYFINPIYLPVRAELDLGQAGKRDTLRLRVTDGFGRVFLRDSRFRERFDLRVAEIESVIDGAVSNAGSDRRNKP
jgi:hypothetical protein